MFVEENILVLELRIVIASEIEISLVGVWVEIFLLMLKFGLELFEVTDVWVGIVVNNLVKWSGICILNFCI